MKDFHEDQIVKKI